MKKVFVTSNVCWSLYNFRRNLIIELVGLGYEVIVYARKDYYTERLVNLGCNFIPLSIQPSGMNPLKDLFTLFSMIKVFRKHRPDFILNFSPKNNIYGSLASIFINARVANNIAGLGVVFIGTSFLTKIVKLLYKCSQRYSEVIFFQNCDDRDVFLNYKLCKPKQIYMLPGSGVDLQRFKPSYILLKDPIIFIMVARMLYDKGVKYYVDAARHLREKYGSSVEFRLLGFVESDNPAAVSRETMNKWSNEGIIKYLGTSDSVEIEMSDSTCVVLPSFYREGVPRSLLEAAALGKPIITTDSVGCKETVVDGFNGYLIEPKSLVSLIDALEKFIELPLNEKVKLGVNSRVKAVQEYDEKIIINKYVKFLSSSKVEVG